MNRRVHARRDSGCLKLKRQDDYVSGADIVRRAIAHTRRMLRAGVHDWPTARRALVRILADLESRSSPDDPSLAELRAFIEQGDRNPIGPEGDAADRG